MKIGRLKRRADGLAAEARSDRLEYKSRVDRVLVIVRRRVGSTAGLAVCFSLGFMAGTGTANSRADSARHGRGTRREHRGPTFMHQLAHGPVGETAMKLGITFLARSLMKLQEDDIGGPPPAAHTAEIAD